MRSTTLRNSRREGLRFTEQRRNVLEALLASHVPASAYDVIDRLAEHGRRPAPLPRSTGRSTFCGAPLAHRIELRNAYVACDRGDDCAAEATLFLLCDKCGTAGETSSAELHTLISSAAAKVGFTPQAPVVEIRGLCANCRG